MDLTKYYKYPKDLARSHGYVSKNTGEMVKFTPSEKLVYVYMVARNEFFTKKREGKHFESQKAVADACGIEEKACGKILRKLKEHGVIDGEKRQPEKGGYPRYYYNTVDTDVVLWLSVHGEVELLGEVVGSGGDTGALSEEPPEFELLPTSVYDDICFDDDEEEELWNT